MSSGLLGLEAALGAYDLVEIRPVEGGGYLSPVEDEEEEDRHEGGEPDEAARAPSPSCARASSLGHDAT